MSAFAIRCQNLRKHFADKVAVGGVDLEVQAGICQGLLGPNGAGKTTTVEMLEGLSDPTSGTIELFGERWRSGHDQRMRQRIGVQLQETQLADKLHVDEVLTVFRSFYPSGRSVEELLEILGLQEQRSQQYARLSGGQKQRVAVACALVGNPELLFLDEPTTGLDPRARQALWDVVRDFRRGGGTVVLTTHYMEEAAALCDEIAIMDRGKVIAQGTPRALMDGLGEVQFVEFELGRKLDDVRLREVSGVTAVEQLGRHYRLTLDRSLGTLRLLLAELDAQQAIPIGLSTHQATLDDVFMKLTGRELHAERPEVALSPEGDQAHV